MLVFHVLYFKGDFFYKPRASLARAAFKRDFLINLKAISFFGSKLRKVKFKGISFKTFFDPRYRPPTPVLVKVKWKVKTKRFFDFPETYIYYTSCIYLLQKQEKCVGQLSYGFNILDKLEGCTHKKKIAYGDLDFSILG